MGRLLYALKRNKYTAKTYAVLKGSKDSLYRISACTGVHRFKNRARGADTLCIVLAGYKEFAYPSVFGRIATAVTPDIDVCVVSSGRYSPVLEDICEQNEWSYLSTRRNNVSLAQNIAIDLHPQANYIFKLDEDIFVCSDYFDHMKTSYEHAKKGKFRIGVLAPLINVNGFGSYYLLERLGLLDDFERRFEPIHCETGRNHPVERRPDVARYLWGEGGKVPSIDALDSIVRDDPSLEVACPHVFSIGAILYERNLWEEMEYLPVQFFGSSLGKDEVKICSFCHMHSRPVMVATNVVVGHLSFKPQNASMQEYYELNTNLFLPQ